MRALPLSIGLIHFVGVGGIGMSGIAEVMHNLGYSVQGSDIAETANVQRLRGLGIPVHIGHTAGNVDGVEVVVVSTAVPDGNPEVDAARERFVPVVRRAEMLGELMRLKWSIAVGGTHGKTTTTSMVASLLDAAGLDPTVINGGIINAYGTNARLGASDWMVVEADESDGSFTKLPATIAMVTNIDPEHMEFYGTPERLHAAFETFVENIPFYGFAVLCIDHPGVQALIGRIRDRRIVTYGFSAQAEVRCCDLRQDAGGAHFAVEVTDRFTGEVERIDDLHLPMVGQHNVLNAVGGLSVGHEMGMSAEQLRGGLARFAGVKRRFTKTGEVDGVTVIDDYGHHPVEIAAVLKAARQCGPNRVIAVMQPHRYTRLSDLFEDFCSCFNDADYVVVAPVHTAGEEPIPGVHRDALVEGLRAHGHRRVVALDGPDALAPLIADVAQPGDMVVCLGAGSITKWANALPDELAAILGPDDNDQAPEERA